MPTDSTVTVKSLLPGLTLDVELTDPTGFTLTISTVWSDK